VEVLLKDTMVGSAEGWVGADAFVASHAAKCMSGLGWPQQIGMARVSWSRRELTRAGCAAAPRCGSPDWRLVVELGEYADTDAIYW